MQYFAERQRSHAPLLWTVLFACCVALASSLNVLPPFFPGGFDHMHLRQQEAPPLADAPNALSPTVVRHLAVFGDDDRRPVGDPSQYPYSAVGLLRWTDTLSCTASLISERFIVTAAECVLDADGTVRKSSFDKPQFLPGYAFKSATAAPDVSGERAFVTKVYKQSDYWKKWTQNTYVILELDVALGKRYGVLQLPTLSDLDQSSGKTEVQLAGYDANALAPTKAALQYAKCTCYFPTGFNGPQYLLLHDCDTSAVGSPGSPLLVRYNNMKTYIIGIHSNAIGSSTATAAAAADATAKYTVFKQENANRGVLSPFIQKQLEALEAAATISATTPADSGAGSLGVSASKPTRAPATTPSGSASSRGRIDDGALNPGPGTTTSVSSDGKQAPIAPAAAYVCIAVVGLAWASIVFIALRHVRRGGDLYKAELSLEESIE